MQFLKFKLDNIKKEAKAKDNKKKPFQVNYEISS